MIPTLTLNVRPRRVLLTPEHYRLLSADSLPEATSRPGGSELHLRIATPLGTIEQVVALSTDSTDSLALLPRSDGDRLGINLPVRSLADTADAPPVTLINIRGEHIEVPAISPERHLHLSAADARYLQLVTDQHVPILVRGTKATDFRQAWRDVVFGGVRVRVTREHCGELHLDTDEGFACGWPGTFEVQILSGSNATLSAAPASYMPHRRFLNEHDVQEAHRKGQRIALTPDMIITPSARDLGRRLNLFD